MRTVFVCLLTVVLAAAAAVPPVFTQSGLSKQEQKTAKTREKIKKLGVGSQAKVKVKLYTGTKYEGYVSLSDNDSFAIVDKSGTQRTVKYSDVDSIGGRGLGWRIGLGIAIGAGVVIAIFAAIAASDD